MDWDCSYSSFRGLLEKLKGASLRRSSLFDRRPSNRRHDRLPDSCGLCDLDVEGLTAKEG